MGVTQFKIEYLMAKIIINLSYLLQYYIAMHWLKIKKKKYVKKNVDM